MTTRERAMLHPNYSVDDRGHFCIGGVDSVILAKKYGTPLYVLDEDAVRRNCRTYYSSVKKHFPPGSTAIYASKALSFKRIYPVINEEGLGADVASAGELYIAKSAGFPMEKILFHGNGKSEADIRFALECSIGCFVVDNREELDTLNRCAGEMGIRQKIQLRLTPGIDPHTFDAVNTGKIDSKFGTAIATGQAFSLTSYALTLRNLDLQGFHCHIGSQIFDDRPFCDAADIMLDYIATVRDKTGFTASVLNLGGGFAVRYTHDDPEISIEENIARLGSHIMDRCGELHIPVPAVILEPGRSIVADAGVTLYTVENVKTIEDYKNYVTVDGGMADNPRYALYRSPYTVLIANRAADNPDALYTIAGRCCESGDMIQEDVPLPAPQRGDIAAVLVTGAYNYSMASNYNWLCRPALVMLRGGTETLAIRHETFADLAACQL
jgi:diaminopimelate decarboxylase